MVRFISPEDGGYAVYEGDADEGIEPRKVAWAQSIEDAALAAASEHIQRVLDTSFEHIKHGLTAEIYDEDSAERATEAVNQGFVLLSEAVMVFHAAREVGVYSNDSGNTERNRQ